MLIICSFFIQKYGEGGGGNNVLDLNQNQRIKVNLFVCSLFWIGFMLQIIIKQNTRQKHWLRSV